MSVKWLIKDWKLGVFRRAKDSPAVKAAKKELRQIGRGIVRKVKANARKRSGALRIATTAKVWEKDDRIVLIIGARTDFTRDWNGKEVRPARYAHLEERSNKYLSRSMDKGDTEALQRQVGAAIKQALGG